MEAILFIVSEPEFFAAPCNIDCEVDVYCAFPGADKVFDTEKVYEKKLTDIGGGIMISDPVIVDKGLRDKGAGSFVSLSHQGILSIYALNEIYTIQFTDLLNDRQVEMEVEHWSTPAFYDDNLILLTYRKPLRESSVEEIFKVANVSAFKDIGDVKKVVPSTDTTLLHSRRTLCYSSDDYISHEYNVDNKINKIIKMEYNVGQYSSLMGINCGIKVVFRDNDEALTYTLSWDNEVTPLRQIWEPGDISAIFVSSSNPKDLSRAVIMYSDYLVKGEVKIEFTEPVKLQRCNSIVRIYRDIFLLYDLNVKKWVLSRITIP